MSIATLYTKIFPLDNIWYINIYVLSWAFSLLGPFPAVPSLYKTIFIQQAKIVEFGTSNLKKNIANTFI